MRKLHRATLLCFAALLAGVATPALFAQVTSKNAKPAASEPAKTTDWSALLPNGAGKEYASALCGRCHTTGVLALQRRSRKSWKDALLGMNAARETGGELCACIGGPIDDEEIELLSSYLSEAFGPKNPIDQLPLNVNNTTLGAMLRLPGIQQSDAEKIIRVRQKSPIRSKQELEKILGRDKFFAIEDFVDVKDSNFRTDGLLPM